jgi:hypothetical protein
MRFIAVIVVLVISTASVAAQRQGIKGQVFWLSGNQMPGPDKSTTPKQGIIREIQIYHVATMSDVVMQDNYFKEVKTGLVAKVVSGKDGFFKVKLPPGEYSVFTVEAGKGLFANIFDVSNKINPIIVKARKFSWLTITVDYESAY